jgi:hypothetical protein
VRLVGFYYKNVRFYCSGILLKEKVSVTDCRMWWKWMHINIVQVNVKLRSGKSHNYTWPRNSVAKKMSITRTVARQCCICCCVHEEEMMPGIWSNCRTCFRKVAGLIPDGVMEFCIDIHPSDCTMALGSTQPLTEMSTGSKCGQCVRLTTLPPSSAVVKKSGNLNVLEPSGPPQACNGTALPLRDLLWS